MSALKKLLTGAAAALVVATSLGVAGPANAAEANHLKDPLAVVQQQGLIGSPAAKAQNEIAARNLAAKPASESKLATVDLTASLPGTTATVENGAKVNRSRGNDYGTVVGTGPNGTKAGYVVINTPMAPSEYKFIVGDASTKLSLNKNGSVTVKNAAGEQVNNILPPWAKDATGKSLPTSYTVSGNTLVQKVDHRGAAYPVVADPEYGCGVPWCSIYFNRGETSLIAAGGSFGALTIKDACKMAPGPAAFVCVLGTGYVTVTALAANGQGKCVGIIAYPSPMPPFASWNTFIYTGSQCH
ncbi:hypothetical protein [Arthrobacter sp. RCC_34]|uniref:hypothetical protein n=1 Tax=Arthrobacter sp. RCC_34 TaxID=3239230 RepID=UPI003523F41F